MKKVIKNNYKKILNIVLVVNTILLIIICILIWNYHYKAVPSMADLKYGLDNTFNEVNNLNCEYYGKAYYGKNVTYKYTCSFDYNKEYEIVSGKTCASCSLKHKKWQCSISTSKCFK